MTLLFDLYQQEQARYLYDPYGNLLAKTGPMADFKRYRFSAKEYDPRTGLYYFGYRFYEPTFQRWLNPDPIGARGGINLYGFVGNNPINYVDPLGLQGIPSPVNIAMGFGPGYGQSTADWNSQFQAANRQATALEAGALAGTATGGAADAFLVGGGFLSGESLAGGFTVGFASGVGGNAAYQGTRMAFGDQNEFDLSELDTSALLGGALGAGLNGLANVVKCPSKVPVSRWPGADESQPGWVMQGPKSPLNYLLSGKPQPSSFPTFGQPPNIPAPYSSGVTINVPPSTLSWPTGPLGPLKGLLGQRMYVP